MGPFAPADTARHYDNAHQRIVGLVRSLADEQLARKVPGTPKWDVHDALAHLAANTTDGLAGRITGIPSEDFTDEQVRQRKALSVEDLIAEWQANLPTMLDAATAGLAPPNLAVDAVTHEQDVRGALGAPPVDDREAVRFSLEMFALGMQFAMKRADSLALRIQATDTDFTQVAGGAGEGGAPATLRATEFELFRTLSGRRGRRAILAMDWDGDATAYLPWLNLFGEVPAYDVVD
jgi:uncharacterized protein (TIGR03083 family)